MSTVLAQREEVIKAPELRGAVLHLFDDLGLEQGIDGPAGCVAGETRIYNPVTGEHVPIKELYEKKIAPTVQTLMGAMHAEVPFRKGVRKLYRVTLTSGRQCIVTENHRILTPKGWRFVSDLSLGDLIGVGEPNVQLSYAHNSTHTSASSQACCLSDCRQYDVPLPHEKDTVLDVPPSLDDARIHGLSDLHMGDQAYELSHSPQPYIHRANKGYSRLFVQMECAQSDDVLGSHERSLEMYQPSAQSGDWILPARPTHEQDQCCHNTHLNASCLTQFPQLLEGSEPDLMKRQAYQPFDECLMSVDRSQELASAVPLLTAYTPSKSSPISYNTTSIPYSNTSWDTVSSIEYERTDEYFDLHVPIAKHYLAEGIWHHNTGKTFGIMYVLHCLLSMYSGTKWLVARKRHVDLVGSALATFRESVLDERENVHFFSGNKERPAAYEYPNGSLMVVNGLDRPGKVKSMDFDGMYICEATDCDLEDIEMCHIRLARRKDSRLPRRFQKLLMDFNPSFPDHFLNLRMNSGLTHRLNSRHEDNPFLYDAVKQDWTEAGYRYIAELETLTGVRLSRYRYGIWAAAEGTVYEDSWDRARNVIDRFPIPKEWPREMVVDFGYTNPFCCKWYAIDGDGRAYVYREIYMTKRLVEDHAKTIKHYSRWGQDGGDPLPRAIICDHDAEDRATLERHLGLYTIPAVKNVSAGIQVTASRYRPAGDGKPRLMYFRDCLVERDRELAAKKKPTSSIEEPDSYVWKQGPGGVIIKEEPVKEDDHGCLIAGTLIKTANGDIPIEQIRAGDYVLTRNGYKRVKAAGMTQQNAEVYTVHFSNGATLTGTGNHPIYLSEQGYTPLRAIRYGDIIMTTEQAYERLSLWEKTWENQKSSFIKASSLGVTLNRLHGVSAITTALTQVIEKLVSCDFIKKYGVMRMAQFHRDMKFITRMKTRLIMSWITWNASPKKIIRNATSFTRTRYEESSCESMSRQKSKRLLRRGTDQKRAERGIVSWLACRMTTGNIGRILVSTVEKSFNQGICGQTLCVSAPTIVNPRLDANQGLMISHQSASIAEKSIWAIGTARDVSVQRNVQQKRDTLTLLRKQEPVQCAREHSRQDGATTKSIALEPVQAVAVCSISKNEALQPVYNMTIENAVGEGEYFANGILVHNCDCDRYFCARHDLRPTDIKYSNRIY